MAFDIIVFSQQELDNALESGIAAIALCDNSFVIPPVGDVCYTAIGHVTALADGKAKDFKRHGVVFNGFTPKFKADIVPVAANVVTAVPSVSSYTSSYMLSSYFMTSYQYEYEYEYEKGSFSSSYHTSWQTSYSSFVSSFHTRYAEGCIMVNGYGINLI